MIPFPNKKYKVIYADPPWEISKVQRISRPNQGKTLDYPTMPLQDIISLPVKMLAEESSVLLLWTIQRYLPHAFRVMEEWGFRYQRVITWDKRNGMCLFGFHHRTEFLLFGYRGKLEMYPKKKAIPTLIEAKSEFHSRKPQIFRDIAASFGNPRIELFARVKSEGWDVWGNEVSMPVERMVSI